MNSNTHAKRAVLAALALAAWGWLAGCTEVPGRGTEDPFLSRSEQIIARSLANLPANPPPDPTNRFAENPQAAALGKQFFFDPRFSGPLIDLTNTDQARGGNGTVSVTGTAVGPTQRIGCVRCHNQDTAFSDQQSVPAETSLGTDIGFRNAITVLNSAYFPYQFWDGRRDSSWAQALDSTENPREMNFTRIGVVQLMRDRYSGPYQALFGPLPDTTFLNQFPNFGAGAFPQFTGQGRPGDGPNSGAFPAYTELTTDQRLTVDSIFANYGKAIAAYERLVVSRTSLFDRFILGEGDAISDEAKKGLKLFIGKGFCINCHNTPRFSDGEYHNIGVAQGGVVSPQVDPGRDGGIPIVLADPFNGAGVFSDDRAFGAAKLADVPNETQRLGAFRTQTLRSIRQTGPYMHTGHLRSLWDVVDFYNRGGDNTAFVGREDVRLGPPLGLTETEIDQIIEFLKTLDGAPLPASVTSFPVLPP